MWSGSSQLEYDVSITSLANGFTCATQQPCAQQASARPRTMHTTTSREPASAGSGHPQGSRPVGWAARGLCSTCGGRGHQVTAGHSPR